MKRSHILFPRSADHREVDVAPKVVMTMTDWRLEVLLEPERTGLPVTEVCRRHEISRDTFYAWKRRFEAVGVAGLLERSREPINQPARIEAELETRIRTMRQQHPRWGAKTIRARLKRMGIEPPSVSTIHRCLVRNGLVVAQPGKRPKAVMRRWERDEPNDLWQMDATTVNLRDGTEVEIVSVLDDHARFLLAALVCPTATCEITWAAFVAAGSAYGLPRQIYTDNHLSFTGRLHRLEVAFERKVKATGVQLIFGRPNYPQGRGKIERFHRTLEEFIEDAGGADDIEGLQAIVDDFRHDYNTDRPHQGIGDLTPAERFRPSGRPLVGFDVIAQPDYEPTDIVRRTSANGVVCWNYIRIALGSEWAGRLVRVVPTDDEIRVFFGDELVRTVEPHPDITYHRLPKLGRVG